MTDEKLKRYAEELVTSIVQRANTILKRRFKSDITLQSDYPRFVNCNYEVIISIYAFYYDPENGRRNSCKVAEINLNAENELRCAFYISDRLIKWEHFLVSHPLYCQRRVYVPFAIAAHTYTVCNVFTLSHSPFISHLMKRNIDIAFHRCGGNSYYIVFLGAGKPKKINILLYFDWNNIRLNYSIDDEISVDGFAPYGDGNLGKAVENLAKACEIMLV